MGLGALCGRAFGRGVTPTRRGSEGMGNEVCVCCRLSDVPLIGCLGLFPTFCTSHLMRRSEVPSWFMAPAVLVACKWKGRCVGEDVNVAQS